MSAEPEARIEAYVQDRIARILLMPPGLQLDRSLPLSALGLDSLMAAELRHWIQRDLGLKLPLADARGRSIADVVEYLRAAVADTGVVPPIEARGLSASAARSTREAIPIANERTASGSAERPWITVAPDPHARLRLFCLPDIGGAAGDFAGWPERLDQAIQVCPIELPGRGARIAEAPFTRLSALLDRLASELAAWLDRPCAIYGCGLGGLIAFELARALREKHGVQPTTLIVAYCRAPQIVDLAPPLHSLPAAELLAHLRRRRHLADPKEAQLPALRADLALEESYVHTTEAPLACSLIVVFDGDEPPGVVTRWAELTGGPFVTQRVHIGRDAPARIQTALVEVVAQNLGAPGTGVDDDRRVVLEEA